MTSENNKLFVTPVYFEHYTNDEIKYFKNMKFKADTWKHLIFFNQKIKEIKQKCSDINYAINYTNDNYYYLLISNIFETFQIKPSINKKTTLDKGTLELINPNLDYNLKEKITNHETIIVSDSVFTVPQNYNFINLPYSYNNKDKRILIPKKCKTKV